MTRTTKILLAVGGVAALGCCALVAATMYLGMQVAQNAQSNPEDVLKTGRAIADFSLPAGLEPKYAFSLMGMSMAVFATGSEAGDAPMTVILAEVPAGEDVSVEQMRDMATARVGSGMRSGREVSSDEVTIRGERTTVTITEGEDRSGASRRQAFALFTSKGGRPAMIIADGAVAGWDQATLDAFIGSLE